MPTNQNAYNSRVTDEALEKKFRDTFKSQGGAELVDDLYASGVIIPIVDFTAAAQGSELRSDLQTAWDFATGHNTVVNTTTSIVTTPGFWKCNLNAVTRQPTQTTFSANVRISDGLSTKIVWEFNTVEESAASVNGFAITSNEFNVFLRAGDSLQVFSSNDDLKIDIWYRQIADVSGNLTNPLGFTSS